MDRWNIYIYICICVYMCVCALNCLKDNCRTLNCMWAAPSFKAWWIQRTWPNGSWVASFAWSCPPWSCPSCPSCSSCSECLAWCGSHAPTSSNQWSMTLNSHGNHMEPSFLLRHRSEDSLQSNLGVAGLQNRGLQVGHASCNHAAVWSGYFRILYSI